MSDLISREALIDYFKDNSNGDYTEWFLEDVVDAINDAQSVNGDEVVISSIVAVGIINGKRQVLPYGATYYTAPQQPQGKYDIFRKAWADALEEAAKICDDEMMYGLSTKIRALIKRNAEGVA